MFQDFRVEGKVIFENSTSIKSWSLKSVSLFYIDIHFSSSVNEGHFVDTKFCTHDLIKENDLNDQFMYPKNHNCITCINCSCITCINLSLHYMNQFIHCII